LSLHYNFYWAGWRRTDLRGRMHVTPLNHQTHHPAA
jgi:hypothetical protein